MDVPTRPTMQESQLLFQNQHYAASAMRDGSLIVQNLRRGVGVRLVGPQASVWIDAISTAIDRDEASALCKGVLAR